jgi:hypothetical protein
MYDRKKKHIRTTIYPLINETKIWILAANFLIAFIAQQNKISVSLFQFTAGR